MHSPDTGSSFGPFLAARSLSARRVTAPDDLSTSTDSFNTDCGAGIHFHATSHAHISASRGLLPVNRPYYYYGVLCSGRPFSYRRHAFAVASASGCRRATTKQRRGPRSDPLSPGPELGAMDSPLLSPRVERGWPATIPMHSVTCSLTSYMMRIAGLAGSHMDQDFTLIALHSHTKHSLIILTRLLYHAQDPQLCGLLLPLSSPLLEDTQASLSLSTVAARGLAAIQEEVSEEDTARRFLKIIFRHHGLREAIVSGQNPRSRPSSGWNFFGCLALS